MARINFDDDIESKEEFWNLLRLVDGDRDWALGKLVRFFRLAQLRFGHNQTIAEEELKNSGLEVMIKSGWAERQGDGYQAKGAEGYFAWYLQKCDASKKGGRPLKTETESRKPELNSDNRDSDSVNPPAPAPAPVPVPVLSKRKNIVTYSESFESIWIKYPEGIKQKAFKAFEATIKTEKQDEDFLKAVDNYLSECKAKNRFLMHLSSFIGSDRTAHPWEEYIDRKPIAPPEPSAPNPVDVVISSVSKFSSGFHLAGDDWEAHKRKVEAAVGVDAWALIQRFGGWQKVHQAASNPIGLRLALKERAS